MFTRVTLSMASRLTFNKTPIKLNLEVMLRVTRVNIPQYCQYMDKCRIKLPVVVVSGVLVEDNDEQ